jgi:hypothetical protein
MNKINITLSKYEKKYMVICILTVLLCLNTEMPVFAANYYVTPAGAGAKSGTDWNNALQGPPAIWSRGDTYYFASGSYPRLVIADVLGAGTVTIKKANSSECSGVAGWNPVYGSGTATFISTQYPHTIKVSNIVIDGQYRGTDWKSGYGLKFVNTYTANYTNGLQFENVISDITVRYVEVSLDETNQNTTNTVYMNALNQDDISNITFQYCYLHSGSQDIILMRKLNNITIDGCYIARNIITGATHGQGISNDCSNNVTIRNSVFEDIQSSGQICSGMSLTCTSDNWKIYNNVFFKTSNPPSPWTNPAGIRNWNGYGTKNYWSIINNTFVNIGGNNATMMIEFPAGSVGNVAYNNIFYNCGDGNAVAISANVTHDYNWYYGMTNKPAEKNRIDGSGNPFVNSTFYNFHLKEGSNAINTGKSDLGSPYNVDKDIKPRGSSWDVGAFVYSTSLLMAPSNFRKMNTN